MPHSRTTGIGTWGATGIRHTPIPAREQSRSRITGPGRIGSFVNPVRELLTVVIFLIVGLGFATRIRHPNSLLAGTLAPVLAVAIFRLVGYSAGFVARRVDRAPR